MRVRTLACTSAAIRAGSFESGICSTRRRIASPKQMLITVVKPGWMSTGPKWATMVSFLPTSVAAAWAINSSSNDSQKPPTTEKADSANTLPRRSPTRTRTREPIWAADGAGRLAAAA